MKTGIDVERFLNRGSASIACYEMAHLVSQTQSGTWSGL